MKVHGKRDTLMYRNWLKMRQRCNNPRQEGYHRHGGRGIRVCKRWSHFANFLTDMGERPSADHHIDRIDTDGDYEPGNCRWTTRKERRTVSGTPEYVVWAGMKQRCTNPKVREFKNYGGRGISFCARWEKFENFYEDMGPRPTSGHELDRINNDGDYEPSNCRWVTRKEQQRNKRNTKTVDIGNGPICVAAAAELPGAVSCMLIHNRLNLGWPDHKAVFTPVKKKVMVDIGYGLIPVREAAKAQQAVDLRLIHNRLRLGWSDHDAVFKPVQKPNRTRVSVFKGD